VNRIYQHAAKPAKRRQAGTSSQAGRSVEIDLTSVCYASRDAQDGEIRTVENYPMTTEMFRIGTYVSTQEKVQS
jgi:hypothetical protein